MIMTIGIDGGGTKTEAVLSDSRGAIIHRLTFGATNPHAVTFETAEKRLAEAAEAMFAYAESLPDEPAVPAICLGVAGVARREEIDRIADSVSAQLAAKGRDARVFVRSDADIALMAAHGKPSGLIAIAGTGSIVYGVAADGSRYRVGGWGHLLGDEGSGYAIGRRTLQAVMQSFDGVLPETALTPLVLRKCALHSSDELKHYVYRPAFGKAEIAAFAELCIEAGEADDAVAAAILKRSAEELAVCVLTIRRKHPDFAHAPVGAAGSMFRHSAYYRACFTARHDAEAAEAPLVLSDRSPALGAALLARMLAEAADGTAL
ncbi:BadF/BadG/BcrA/BcrD ATPase family protein [Paenibacillus cymbidii]|uniref:BadF/BadG/BcrA/BcrD ATPase family protein n=1 Tax=Paenibacillus cymbidii TaxID=1639034 RepID=UPI001081C12F|nr:BadF/BadG/BcrA/BcrD ATPase family protein [Paenibacillus cymbidii]